MKKTLAALAVLGAFAGSAAATDVQLYGVVDEGLIYTNTKVTDEKSVDQLQLKSGRNLGSRWGLKGSEDLGNGYKVGFKLESGFEADSGTLQENRLFRREAGLTLYGPFGSLGLGRFGGIASAAGTYDLIGYVESFDGGDNNVWGFASSSRYDNVVAYQTPRFAGLQLTAQYSFKTDSAAKNDTPTGFSGDEGTSAAKRYASIGVSGDYGAAQFAAGYELTKYGANSAGDREVADKDGSLFFVGGNYNFEVVRVYAEAQYFEGLAGINNDYKFANQGKAASDGLKGYGLHLGAKAPIAAGTLTAGLYYVDAKEDLTTEADQDFKYYGVSARYVYPLSKRTSVYGGAGYGQTTVDGAAGKADQDTKLVQAYVGLTHTF
ncbi:porin [Sutterella wadsworthensis]|uniref:porin n=2 Tax=Sutterella wadsworthensis TaxID=40545 RepID=UPI0024331A49|nr:porin [Sutterella wadsworthensis]